QYLWGSAYSLFNHFDAIPRLWNQRIHGSEWVIANENIESSFCDYRNELIVDLDVLLHGSRSAKDFLEELAECRLVFDIAASVGVGVILDDLRRYGGWRKISIDS
ncbi:hypothetical protein B0A49_12060, partial [Cryomyces minteri]